MNSTCEICLESYNMETRIPKSLYCCGKTICRKCLETLLHNFDSKCPWCKSRFNVNVHVYKTNIQLLDIVQEESQWEKCPHHNENMKLVCRQDKKKVCPYCGIGSDCKDHGLTHLLDLKPTSDQRLGELQGQFSQANEKMKQYHKVINQSRTTFQNVVCENFDQQIFELKKAKATILMKFNAILSNKQAEVNNAFGQNSSLRLDLQGKIDDHMNFLKARDPLNVIEEDLSILKQRADLFIAQEVPEQPLLEMAQLVQKQFDHVFSGLKKEGFDEVIEKEAVEIPVIKGELKEDVEELSLEVEGFSVEFEKKGNEKVLLFVLEKRWEPLKTIKVDYGQVKESERIVIDLHAIQWSEYNLKALELILSSQAKNSKIHFVSVQPPLTQEMETTSRLFSVLFKKPQEIKELSVDLSPDNNFVMLLNAILPQLSSLRKLKVRYIAPGISQQNLNEFAKNLLILASNLEDLHLDVSYSSFPVEKLYLSMPILKRLDLSVSGIVGFNDKLFSKIMENLSVSVPLVQNFHIDVSETSVTHSCVHAMREKIRHIPARLISNRDYYHGMTSKIRELDDLFG